MLHRNSYLKNIDRSLLLLVVFVIAVNIPYLNHEFMVGHDTKNVYATFHYFYNHFFWYNELPHWMPFGEYGKNTLFFQISNVSPCSYFIGLLGWISGARDTLFLFKLSVLAELMIFVLGLHLLTRRLYKHRWTSLVISLLGVGSVVWYWQIYWDLRLYYLLPLTIYFFLRFVEDMQAWALWAALLTLVFSLVGGLAYWAPVYALLLLVLALLSLPSTWGSYKCLLKPEWRNWLCCIILVCCLTALGYVLVTCLDGLQNYSPGRSPFDMRTPLATYLTYASPSHWRLLHAFLDGTRPETEKYTDMSSPLAPLPDQFFPDDITLYVGLLPVAGLAVALMRVRNAWFYSLFGSMIAMLALAGSGAFSWMMYWVMPGMNMFRHLSLLLEITKILLLLAGGFGLDVLIAKITDRKWLNRHFRFFNLFALLAGLFLILDMVVSTTLHKPESWNSPAHVKTLLPTGGEWIVLRISVWAFVLVGFYIISRKSQLPRCIGPGLLKGVLLLACLVDIGSFQGSYWANRIQGEYAGKLDLEQLHFSDKRTLYPATETTQKNAILFSSPFGVYHAYYSNITQYDPCLPYGLVTIFPKGVHELASGRGAQLSQTSIGSSLIPENDSQLRIVMGCNAPKLRIAPQSIFGSTDQELRILIKSSAALDSEVILRGKEEDYPFSPPWVDSAPLSYSVSFFNANRLDLDMVVKPGRTGWFIYSDAYDPRWKATINGKETKVLEAYMAFKAIYLPEGNSKVSFIFNDSRQNTAMGWLIIVGICLAGCGLAYLVWQVSVGQREVVNRIAG